MTLLERFSAPSAVRSERAISINWLAGLLIAASIVELTILRVGTRTAVHIPDIDTVAGPYRLAATAGRFAFFSAVVLLGVLLVKIVLERYESTDFQAAAAVTMFLVTAAGVRSGLVTADWASAVVATAVAVMATLVALRRTLPEAFVIAMFGVGYLLVALQSIAQPGLSGDLIDGLGAARWLRGAELLVVGAALASWPVWRRISLQRWWIGGRLGWGSALAGVVVAGALAGNASTTTVLMMWNFGLTGTLPAALYGLATMSVMLTIGTLRRASQARLALALALLVLGGLGLTSTYQSGLTVAGLALLLPDAGWRDTSEQRRTGSLTRSSNSV